MPIKKLFVLFFLFLSFLVVPSVSKTVLAFSTPEDMAQSKMLYDKAIASPDMNLQSFVHEVVKALINSGVAMGVGCMTDCPTNQPAGTGGLTQSLAYMIGSVYVSKPASGIDYVADLGSKLGIAKNVYAADLPGGFGFNRIPAALPLWKMFRDVSYLFFVLVFVVTGFAVMFRFKIDPRTIITLEAALPKIIIGLILVTFSYAIVGFMVDIMFIINNLIISIFHQAGSTPVTSDMETLSFILRQGFGPFLRASLFFVAAGAVGGALVGGSIGTVVLPVIGSIGAGAGGAVAGSIIMLILFAIILIVALIRLLLVLIKAYVNVVLATIFAPIMILVGTFPGSSTTSSWFKNLLANLAVLPAALTMAFVAGTLASTNAPPGTVTDLASAITALKNWVANGPTYFMMLFVSLGILFMIPKVADMIKNVMAGKSFGDRIGVGESYKPVANLGLAGVTAAGYGGRGPLGGQLTNKSTRSNAEGIIKTLQGLLR